MTVAWSGLSVGAIYALLAVTLNVIYTSVGIFNFAQGAILTLGVYVAYAASSEGHLAVVPSVILGAAVCAVSGLVEARIVLLPRARGRNELMTTVGAATVLTGAVGLIWGENDLQVESPVSSKAITLLGGRVDPDQLVLIGLAVIATVALSLWYRFTLSGLSALAVAEDRDAARIRGINVVRKSFGAFAFAGGLAGFTGLAVGSQTYAYPDLGSSLVLFAFVAFVLGGSGSVGGSLLGGFVIGMVEEFSARYIGVLYSDLIVLGLLLGILIILPNGLFGKSSVRTV